MAIDMDDLNRDSTTIVLSHEMIETVTDWACGIGAVSRRRPFARVCRSNTLTTRHATRGCQAS